MVVQLDQRQDWIRSRRHKRNGAKAARLRRQFIRYILLTMLLLGGVYVFQNTPWKLADPEKDISISGNMVTSADQIEAVIGDYLDKPIYEMDPKKLEKRINMLPSVKFAFVRRYAIPHPRLVIQILEETPWATFYSDPDGEPEAVIAQSGRMIPLKDFPNVQQPELKIYGPQTLKMTNADVGQWASWATYIADQTKQTVESIDMRQPFDVRVQDGDLVLKLGTPDTTLTRRLGRLASVMEAIEPLRSKIDYVDLALDNNVPLKLAKKSDLPHGILN
jgi:cell division septal protein FtsQ